MSEKSKLNRQAIYKSLEFLIEIADKWDKLNSDINGKSNSISKLTAGSAELTSDAIDAAIDSPTTTQTINY